MSTQTLTFPATPMMRALAACVRSRVPVLIWGEPGQGKTAVIESHAAAWQMHCETVVGSIREATDFLGLPIEDDGRVVYAPPAWAPRLAEAETGPLFLDELTTSAPSVQKAMLRVLQERVVGEQPLGENVAIVAAANPPETAVDGWDLPAPIANRLVHLDWKFDAATWLDGLVTGFGTLDAPSMADLLGEADSQARTVAAQTVARFLAHRRDLIAPPVPSDPTEAGKAWASPRSWHNAAVVLAELDPRDQDASALVLTGTVGAQAAKEFMAWRATQDLVDPAEVIADPRSVDWSGERPDRLFVLVQSVAALAVSDDTTGTWTGAIRALTLCAEAGKPDVALASMRTLLAKRPSGVRIPARTRDAFADLFTHAARWTDKEAA
ncbi:sigma 54-interacting transcriptional regulator [Isoptericola croceus]|uniref:sigma 54-interacting transcriptional regulator n=1 Tax=Isoptericola croceus TaxID=3031406 RepID=UPI0023F99729|nr:sigma 54-interacting transcriptional regulator [Isoptericola croceus]